MIVYMIKRKESNHERNSNYDQIPKQTLKKTKQTWKKGGLAGQLTRSSLIYAYIYIYIHVDSNQRSWAKRKDKHTQSVIGCTLW